MNALINNLQDHIMANTWRLIFERQPYLATTEASTSRSTPNFSRLEDVLPEYRLIGLEIVAGQKSRYH